MEEASCSAVHHSEWYNDGVTCNVLELPEVFEYINFVTGYLSFLHQRGVEFIVQLCGVFDCACAGGTSDADDASVATMMTLASVMSDQLDFECCQFVP